MESGGIDDRIRWQICATDSMQHLSAVMQQQRREYKEVYVLEREVCGEGDAGW